MTNNAQDREAIVATIQKYMDGVAQSNTDFIAEAFHPQATMSGHFGEEFLIVPAAEDIIEYMKSVPPTSETSPNYSNRIVSIEQTGTMAQATIMELQLEGMDFTTHFQLHLVEGNWLITAKATYAQ
jgi:hypothetical protein